MAYGVLRTHPSMTLARNQWHGILSLFPWTGAKGSPSSPEEQFTTLRNQCCRRTWISAFSPAFPGRSGPLPRSSSQCK